MPLIIGQPKNLNEVEPFADEQLDAFIQGVQSTVTQGIPFEVPTQMPIGMLAQLAATLGIYRHIGKGVLNAYTDEDIDEDDRVAAVAEAVAALKQMASIESKAKIGVGVSATPANEPGPADQMSKKGKSKLFTP